MPVSSFSFRVSNEFRFRFIRKFPLSDRIYSLTILFGELVELGARRGAAEANSAQCVKTAGVKEKFGGAGETLSTGLGRRRRLGHQPLPLLPLLRPSVFFFLPPPFS